METSLADRIGRIKSIPPPPPLVPQKSLRDFLHETAQAISTEFLPEGWVGRIEINYFEGGGSINILESFKFKKRQ